MMEPSLARSMWQTLEPVHAIVYFAPETATCYADAGLKGYWMGYFASRAAPMGAVPAEVVIATFYNFHPGRVRRAIPDAWTLSTPQKVLEARLRVADAGLRRAIDLDAPALAETAALAEEAARAASPQGRALFAGHAALDWPEEPHLRLWHAATLLREHRGDGHVAALVAEGIDGFEAHVLAAAAGRVDPGYQRTARGISEEEWADALARLADRKLVTAEGAFTEAGRELSARIESVTDERALAPYAALGEECCSALAAAVDSLFRSDEIPFPNPIGLTRA